MTFAAVDSRANSLISPLSLSLSLSLKPKKISDSRFEDMAQSGGKKIIRIDAIVDTVCPWCFVGKKNLDIAINSSKDQFDFEIRWHPFFLEPSAPKEGLPKAEVYRKKFGATQWDQKAYRMAQIFRSHGFEYDTSGLTGNSLDSHRLVTFAGTQGLDKQNALVEELFMNYFVQGKYIGDRQVLVDAANKVGVEGAAVLLEDPNNGMKEVYEQFEKYASQISGVPHFVINGKQEVIGAQAPQTFLRAFRAATS